ncbi:Penicillin-insensitive murein endopeptidase [hydrothermal vent metagenome]|uniref:Penicillin-insensitive murein endopeptidase n=1 Tax=hydrothermal vent metagenome TaxID=652676 RepID=A0A3B0RR44_9ZZZZ
MGIAKPFVRTLAVALAFAATTVFGPALAQVTPAQNSSKLDTTVAKKLFGSAKSFAPLPSQAVGFYSKGCLAGAEELPITGPAWQAMRLNRNRNWGHPDLVALIKRLAIESKADGWNGLLVGDMSQPRGGPMLTGHASHQVGLDTDIWLTPMPDRVLTRKERRTTSATLMVLDRKRINPKRWTNTHNRLIRRAASYKEVQRIFVHPPIKKALCDWSKDQADRSWLKKVRAYYGHNYHFHIRMRCPEGQKGCRAQTEPEPKDGTGCGAELAYWMSDKPWRPAKPRPPGKKPKPRKQAMLADLPALCRTVITAQ